MQQAVQRRYYIDWIRVLAFFLLIFFHCAMPFVIFGWEVKNEDTSMGLSRLIWWMHQWRIPLLFFISGVGIHYSLQKRSVLKFAGERVVRLFIPLLFAMFFTIPLQVYFEKLQRGKFSGSYADFYPTVWEMVPYPDGSLTWSHMWFVVYLFVFCLLLLPVFALFRIKWLAMMKQKAAAWLSNPFMLLVIVLPFTYYYFTLYLSYPEQQSLLDDWFLFVYSVTLLLYGYVLGGNEQFWASSERYRYLFLIITITCAAYLMVNYWWQMDLPKQEGTRFSVYGTVNSLHVWCMILTSAGFVKKYLNFSNRFLQYATEVVYPFYILHQTWIVAFGYYVVQWSVPIAVKLPVLIVLCFVSLYLLYNGIIKRFIITRILYGLKWKQSRIEYKEAVTGVNLL
jgi:glucans biosynthesis protein C